MSHRRLTHRVAAKVAIACIACALAVTVVACGTATQAPKSADSPGESGARPNVILIMTDDQETPSIEVMPKLKRHLMERGVTFENSFVSYPLCCPSRATFQTGQYAHNHGVTANRPPEGGYPAFEAEETLPVWLQRAGYETAYIGKYMNDYTKKDPIPPGWDRWFGLVEPSSRYFKAKVNDQGKFTKFGKEKPEDYSTDLFTDRAVEFIEERESSDDPFYMSVGYVSPHVAKSFIEKGHCSDSGPQPAPRHLGAFDDRKIPRGPSFNENDVSDKPLGIRKLKKIEGKKLAAKTDKYQCRLETLLSVDDGVGEIVKALERTDELDNTYVAFVSDNGFVQGEHRIEGGKAVPYEGAIRVPFVMRGPDMPEGEVAAQLASNVDWAATVLDLARASDAARVPVDGQSLVPAMTDPGSLDGRAVLIESEVEPEAFQGVRTGRYLYVERAGGETELYDLREDPDELESVGESVVYSRARESLRALLDRLRNCAGAECVTTPQLELMAERLKGDECRRTKIRFALDGPDAEFVVGLKAGAPGERAARSASAPSTLDIGTQKATDLSVKAELADGREAGLRAKLPACG